jgi:hypothetical protein
MPERQGQALPAVAGEKPNTQTRRAQET